MRIDDTQVGGSHYGPGNEIQHWDLAAVRKYDYFQGVITKYVDRWKEKNGLQDLQKAMHYLMKYFIVSGGDLGQLMHDLGWEPRARHDMALGGLTVDKGSHNVDPPGREETWVLQSEGIVCRKCQEYIPIQNVREHDKDALEAIYEVHLCSHDELPTAGGRYGD
jgi:hypothetical protein